MQGPQSYNHLLHGLLAERILAVATGAKDQNTSEQMLCRHGITIHIQVIQPLLIFSAKLTTEVSQREGSVDILIPSLGIQDQVVFIRFVKDL